ncbi:hypothetical protein [Chryseobacterium viscerum]|uniref:HTH cro/C1-type domain-containing protein n=1 Tax=Chryseobacterium viscerum TaxID=1037377 RepID=A0A5N4BJ75_9FLAO|nr:hypothetical protein [Chryseobacterium viscerum]KAB1228489.1 hypothetical protein F8D52_22720 [Chryseobacterium viscerum]
MQDKYDRIDIARRELGLTFEDLKSLFEISPDAIRKAIVVRKNLKPIYINKFIESYGISKNWIETGNGEMKGNIESVISEKTKKDIFDDKNWPIEVIKLLQQQKEAFDAIQTIQDRKISILSDKVDKLTTELNQLKLSSGKH